MADNIDITPGTGKTVGTDEITTLNDVGGAYGHFQRIKITYGADSFATDVTSTAGFPVQPVFGAVSANAFPAGFQRVTDEPTQLFYDPFDSALDTTNRWVTPTSAGGGVAAVNASGSMTLGSGTTAGGYSYLTSQPSFTPSIPAWLSNSWAIQIENAVGNNAVRFWGHGIVSGSAPTSANPLGSTGNGYGFELDISGVLNAVVYSNGTRTAVGTLSTLQPADANPHRYICFYRTDRIYWYVDGLGSTQLGATSNFQSPNIQTLPLLALAVAHTSGPASSRVFTCMGLAVSDTGKNNKTISDGTFPWRKITVSANGDLSVVQSLANSTVVNRSGTITAGGTAQTLAAANSSRVGLTIQNISAGDLMITEDGTTTASITAGYRLSPGSTGKVNTEKLISIWGATTGQAFTATEF